MTSATRNTWTELVEAELATADTPVLAETFHRMATAYEQACLPDAALAVLRKASAFGIEPQALLPELLRTLRGQRRFPELNAAVQTGLAIASRSPDLRRELAVALSSLGQIPAAEQEWTSLIRSGCITETGWLDFARFVMSCADPPSLARIAATIAERTELKGHGLVNYCIARNLIGQDVVQAQRLLREIEPASIPDPDILLDLAILSWRVGDYAGADTAATLAARYETAPPACAVIRGTIKSFAGDFSLLRKASLPMVGLAQGFVLQIASRMRPDSATWGVVHRQPSGSLGMRAFDLTTQPDMDIPEELDAVTTFSVLSHTFRPDPFDILWGVDWSWPHIMLQRKAGGDALHFFVEARGRKDWLWEEVTPDRGDVVQNPACVHPQQSATWIRALQELGDYEREEQ